MLAHQRNPPGLIVFVCPACLKIVSLPDMLSVYVCCALRRGAHTSQFCKDVTAPLPWRVLNVSMLVKRVVLAICMRT